MAATRRAVYSNHGRVSAACGGLVRGLVRTIVSPGGMQQGPPPDAAAVLSEASEAYGASVASLGLGAGFMRRGYHSALVRRHGQAAVVSLLLVNLRSGTSCVVGEVILRHPQQGVGQPPTRRLLCGDGQMILRECLATEFQVCVDRSEGASSGGPPTMLVDASGSMSLA